MITCTRYHDISCGHRVVGHEGKCVGLHGHNYRIHFEAAMEESSNGLDQLGRVIDFGVLKSHLCQWLEAQWDHKMLLWEEDPLARILQDQAPAGGAMATWEARKQLVGSIVLVPFNPTAEEMAYFLLHHTGPTQLAGTGVRLFSVIVEETRKCSATAVLD